MFGAVSASGANIAVSPTPVRSKTMLPNGVLGRAGAAEGADAEGALGCAAEGAAVDVPWAASGAAANTSAATTSALLLWVIEEISSESVERRTRRARSEATTPWRQQVVRRKTVGAAPQDRSKPSGSESVGSESVGSESVGSESKGSESKGSESPLWHL